jgi:RHS repeat-associated protein
LAKNFDPFGNVDGSVGNGSSMFGYTNEYTSQGLVYLKARFYSSYLNQFIQPDTIVPDPRIPEGWNKYLYTRDNPVNYTDPSGHCSNVGIQFFSSCLIDKPAPDYADPELLHQDQLFSEVFEGTGLNGTWTNNDWEYYYQNRGKIYRDSTQWVTKDPASSWDLFAYHVERLAKHYSSNQQNQFVRDFASPFGGLPALGSYISATWGFQPWSCSSL